MTAPTHFVVSNFLLGLLGANIWESGFVSLVFSGLPDIDNPKSFFGKIPYLKKLSYKISSKYGHRTITHSLLAIMGLGVILLPVVFFNPKLYAFCIASYASHPLVDMGNKDGVTFLYPISIEPFFWYTFAKLLMRVKSIAEFVFAFILLVGTSFMFAQGNFNLKDFLLNITGEAFQRYVTAYEIYRKNIDYYNYAKVSVHDDKMKRNVEYDALVLSMQEGRMIILNDGKKLLIEKDWVSNIEMRTDKTKTLKVTPHVRDFKQLVKQNGLFFVSGTIEIINPTKELMSGFVNTDYVQYEKQGSDLNRKEVIKLSFASFEEIRHLIEFDLTLEMKKQKLGKKSLNNEMYNLERKIESYINQKNILEIDDEGKFSEEKRRVNSREIERLSDLINKTKSQLSSLQIRIDAGKDSFEEEIEALDKVRLFYDLIVYDMEV